MKKKRFIAAALVFLLAHSAPVSAFAQEYNIDEGDIQVTAKSDGMQYVTHDAKTVAFTIGTDKTDISDILENK